MSNNILFTITKKISIQYIGKFKELSVSIDQYLIPQKLEKKSNAEVSIPYKLRQEMLDCMPIEFWTDVRRVFEPCAGKGGFVIDIIDRFMTGLVDRILDEKERYRTIVKQCLYFSDINPTNIFICKLLIDPYNEYKLNYNEGNTLDIDCKEKWNIGGFHAVIGNPPYNSSGNTGTRNTVWQDFTKDALNKWIIPNGYLSYVHPPGWRKPCYQKSQLKGLFELMTHKNHMIYLSIHGIKDGIRTFKCGTKYDWYLIQRKSHNKKTNISDENNKKYKLKLKKFKWLPNYNITKIQNILSNDSTNNLHVIMDSAYHATRKYVKDTKTDEYLYTLIHSTPSSGIRYKYTNINNKGHFGVPKIIFGEAGINHVVVDMLGEYGMTQGAMGIVVDNKTEAMNIKKALLSKRFNTILKACMWGNFRIDWKLFTHFRKDFWKDFINGTV